MRHLLLLIFISINCLVLSCQSKINNTIGTEIYLTNQTENCLENPNFMDSILGNKKVIFLGELNHGDGTSFLTKTKLIKYLHEQLGYNTLAFEASFINCNFFWNNLDEKTNVSLLSKKTIYYIWSEVKETQELFRYIQEQKVNGTPLKIVGIDPQFSGRSNADIFISKLEHKLLQIDSNIINKKNYKDFTYELKIQSEWLKYPELIDHIITKQQFHQHLEKYQDIILANLQKQEKDLWKMYFQNIKVMSSIKWSKKKNQKPSPFAIRDKQMFQNLDYILKENNENKIIVWAASAHITRKDNKLKGTGANSSLIGIKKLGDYTFEKYKEKVYSIAFTAGSGTLLKFYNKTEQIIPKHKTNSIEHHLKSNEIVFVDLKKFEENFKTTNYEAMLFYPDFKCNTKWSNHYNGIIYIDRMKPSTPLW